MSVVVFELNGPMAHYRRPDTIGAHASYPFIPRTTLRGLIAAILGLRQLPDQDPLPHEARCGLKLLAAPRTVSQQLSFHGKKWIGAGNNDAFNRPTTVEIVVDPHYRVYYQGPLADDLAEKIDKKQSVFHTYLGAAYCLTFPRWGETGGVKNSKPIDDSEVMIKCATVVPTAAIARLETETDRSYARVGGFVREHIGGRRFRGVVSVLYETSGEPIRIERKPDPIDPDCRFVAVQDENEGYVCLW